jgi:phosphoglycolate phosphatase-like HAD superfamily hydrolase
VSVLVVFDIDGTLLDTRPSFDRIVRELSGATDDDLRIFRAHGGFNDDWELARAATCWIGAGRPAILERCAHVHDVVAWCSHDPGDLAARGIALYRGGLWQQERLLVDGQQLHELAEQVPVAACTGRDRWELERAEELLSFSFFRATTAEQVKKPDPQALVRLLDDDTDAVLMVGDTHADRRTVEAARTVRPDVRFHYRHVVDERTAARIIAQLLEGTDVAHVEDAASRNGEA